jgi:hypothetical protein
MDFITDLDSGIVVDRVGLNKLKTEELGTAMSDIYGRGKEVLVVDNVRAFFSDLNLFRALEDNAPSLTLILEQRGVKLEDEQVSAINTFAELKGYIKQQLESLKPPAPPYVFADVPTSWSVAKNISIGKSSIRRVAAATRGGGYCIGLKAFATLWAKCGKQWATGEDLGRGRSVGHVWASGYNNNAEVSATHVIIGCQNIKRYEMEQVALAMSLPFPEMIAAAD